MKKIITLITFISLCSLVKAQQDSLPVKTGNSIMPDTARPTSYKTTGKAVTGTAGVYSLIHDSAQTASGEMFLNNQLTAASNRFELNTWVKLTNLTTKKTLLVRINDRVSSKMQKKGRVIVLTREAAGKLNLIKDNSIKIKVQSIFSIHTNSQIKSKIDTIILYRDTTFLNDTLTPNTFKTTGKAITGIASFYSHNLDGTKTATGEIYRNSKLTAASNNFKLNAWVLVTNLKNKKSVIVRINDRMHPRMKKKGRVVDMSGEAARLLDYEEAGLARVKVQPVIFFNSPAVKQQLDSLRAAQDSTNRIDSVKTDSVKSADIQEITGIASFYSSNLDGTRTATGERYRNSKLSAASNNFDLNTWVRVTNLRNNKSVILRINDRMHPGKKKKGRVVDLSRAAARKLDFISNGLTKVKVEIVAEGTLE